MKSILTSPPSEVAGRELGLQSEQMVEGASPGGVRESVPVSVKQRRLQAPQSTVAPVRRVVAPTLSAAIVY